MILKIVTNPNPITVGSQVVFFTGEYDVDTYPRHIRTGVVIETEPIKVNESGTNKIWEPKPSDIILTESKVIYIDA